MYRPRRRLVHVVRRTLVVALLAAPAAGVAAVDQPAAELTGRVLRAGERTSAGGPFVLDGLAPTEPLARGGDFELLPGGKASSKESGGDGSCLCGWLFADGFESGDTSAWTSTTP